MTDEEDMIYRLFPSSVDKVSLQEIFHSAGDCKIFGIISEITENVYDDLLAYLHA